MTRVVKPIAIGLALLAGTGLILLLLRLIAPLEFIARGWLLAFAVWSSVPVGSLVLLLIHRLTGGEWGRAAAPVLRPAAAIVPLVGAAFLPILFALPAIYPWAADPASVPPDVARWYLNGPSFLARAGVAIGVWALLGVAVAFGAVGRLLAGLGLAFFGLMISLVAVDWYLSVEPRYTASAFAAMIAVQQMLAALAVAAVIGAPELDGKAAGDLAGLLMATLLGVVYLEMMTFVVAWYGDLPEKAAWFVKRGTSGWVAALVTASLLGALVPFGLLMVRAARRSRTGLRIAGGLILIGIVLHFTWLIVPTFGASFAVIAVALFGLAAMGLISLVIGSALRPHAVGHHAG